MLCLAMLTGGCASGSSSGISAEELYNEYDSSNNNTISQDEWDQEYEKVDTNGDGVVTHDEFNAAVDGFSGRGRR